MTSAPAIPPAAINRALKGLFGLDACSLHGASLLDEREKHWVVELVLRRDVGVKFIGTSTRWCVLLDPAYPFGRVSVYPADSGGLSVTFPHQSRNTPSRSPRAWRNGRLCLDTPFGDERRGGVVADPVGDADNRLRWHVERALEWLHRAANGQLLAPGDPFELPERPHTLLRDWARARVVHDESTATFGAWDGRRARFGAVRFGGLTALGNVVCVKQFEEERGSVVRSWSGRSLRDLANEQQMDGFWWLWPRPILLPPWQAPGTWRDLRRIAAMMRIDVDAMLRWLFPQIRGSTRPGILMLGYPISSRVGEAATEVHWDALLLPRLESAAGQPRGFRANSRGWWHRDRYGKFAGSVQLEYLYTENWNGARLQARGRLPDSVRDCNIALLGVGALGSALAEMLVRAGVERIALFDGDKVHAGNVTRHVATLVDVDDSKVAVVSRLLRQISPNVRVAWIEHPLDGSATSIEKDLDAYDLIIDCTAVNSVLTLLSRAWWSIPRTFASFSLGFRGARLFSFGASGNQFPADEFQRAVQPWLEYEAKEWRSADEVLEGAGCWSPLFPARCDDVRLAAAVCVKELESLVARRPAAPRLRVFAQSSSDDGFVGFATESAPPGRDVLAS